MGFWGTLGPHRRFQQAPFDPVVLARNPARVFLQQHLDAVAEPCGNRRMRAIVAKVWRVCTLIPSSPNLLVVQTSRVRRWHAASTALGFAVLPSQANFLFAAHETASASELASRLRERAIALEKSSWHFIA
jgi:hypothetical protein